METPLFIENRNVRLFGVLHQPDPDIRGEIVANRTGLIFCSPFAEEKLISHRIMVNFARTLSDRGFHVLRFDYMGEGDSAGSFESTTVETRLSDIYQAKEFLRKETGVTKISFLGVRFGATLAALSYKLNDEMEALILIAPIVDGSRYIDTYLRSNLTTQMAIFKKIEKTREDLILDLMDGREVNVDGYILNKDFYLQIKAIDLLSVPLYSPTKLLIVDFLQGKRRLVGGPTVELCKRYENQGVSVTLLQTDEAPFWKENKIYNAHANKTEELLCNWLIQALSE